LHVLNSLMSLLVKYHQMVIGSLLSVLIFRLHANESFFVGDDFQVYQAWKDPNSLMSNNITAIRDFSLDKWRPLNNFATSTVMSTIDSYSDWNFLAILSWLIILSLMLVIRKSWSQTNKAHVVLGLILITLSPTLWWVQNSVFVFLELGPIIAILVGLILFERANKSGSKTSIIYSAIWMGSAGFFHERFYIASFTLALLCYLRSRKDPIYKSGHLFFCVIPLIWLYTMIIPLGANPLRGGGETGFSKNIGIWIIRNFYTAFSEIFKLSGQVIVLDSTALTSFDYAVVVALFLSLFTLTFLIRKHLGIKGLELWLLTLTTALPAGLVYERVEPRWLLAPTIFICLLAWMFFDQKKSAIVRYISFIPIIALSYLTITVQNDYEQFEEWRHSSQELVEFASKYAPNEGEWHLSVEFLDDSEEWRSWALGGGAVFSENISNGPWTYNQYVEECPSRCINLQVMEVNGETLITLKK
jgi:hypothetical protein